MTKLKLILRPDADCPDAAEVLVSGNVCGADYTFLLDTGAAVSRIANDLHTSQFSVVSRRKRETAFSKYTDDMVILPELNFNGLVKTDFHLTRAAPGDPEAPNLLGMDFLRDYCCRFNFSAGELILEDEPLSDSPNRELTLDKCAHPFIKVNLEGNDAIAAWDTGAGLTIAGLGFLRAHARLFQETGRIEAEDSGGATRGVRMFRMVPFHIAGAVIPEQLIVGLDLAPLNARSEFAVDMIIGYNTICRAAWVFDFPRRKWAIIQP